MEREKRKLLDAIRELMERGLLFGSWGNLSIRKNDRIVITPSAIPYSRMKTRDISIIDLSGRHIAGGKPSSEWRMHAQIYKTLEAKAIIHLHSPYATIFSLARKAVKCRTEDSIQVIGDSIPVARYFQTGTKDLAFEVAEKARKARAVIMANHGLVVHGRSMEEALYAAIIAEKTCMAEAFSRLVGRPKDIPAKDREGLKEKYRKYSGKLLK